MRAEIGSSARNASGAQKVAASWTSRIILTASAQEPAHRTSILGQLNDRPLQHAANRPVEPADLVWPEAVAQASGMDPRLPEDLIRIDVADSGDEVLTKQQPFDRSPSCRQELTPSRESEVTLEGLNPQPLEGLKVLLGLHDIHVAKTPLVDEPQLETPKLKDDARMRVQRSQSPGLLEVARHPQVRD
jgi:hypothetical protein